MRYLIFGDIHGNLPALEKLFRVEKDNYDQAICHGDVVNYGPWSNECVELLQDTADIITLRGNHEDAFLAGSYPGKNEMVKKFFEKCFSGFDKLDVIEQYGESFKTRNFTITHTIADTYFYPDSVLTSELLDENYIIGHSHYQFERTHDKKRLINTGSIGQNRKFINIAEYVLLDEEKEAVELKSFKSDIDVVINEMKSQNYPQVCLEYYQKKPLKL